MNTMPLVHIFRNLRFLCSVFAALIVCLSSNAWAGVLKSNYIYEVLLDVDGSTGKDVTVKQLGETSVKRNIDYKIRALAYLSEPLSEHSNAMVLDTRVFKWNETGFEIIKSDSTLYPIGINTGKGNSHTVEIAVDLADLGNPHGIMRGAFHASKAEGQSDFSEDFQLDPGSDTPIPTLSQWGMIILAVLLILLALVTIKKGNQRLRHLTLIILAAISIAAIARAAGFMLDGKVNDWSGIDPVITDTAWDSSAGDPREDILYGFVQREGNRVYFRVDINPAVPQMPPGVILSADPEAIEAGNFSTLNWTSANAVSCIIVPGIGNVDLNGSVSVSPNETTTYSITATGPGGTATNSATVTVNEPVINPPTVSIAADPDSIVTGESSTLTWSSANTESVSIDQGIGSVDVNGSVTVSPTETTTYTITATGPGGTATDSVVITAVDPIKLNISSPSGHDTVSGTSIMVLGTVTNKRGSETGVIVNGMPAVVTGGKFVANHVPLQQGENTITVNAKDINGFIASATVSVNAVLPADYIKLTADIESGTAPFETTLTLDGSFTFISPAITYTGPGVVEFPDNLNENEYTVKMTKQGIYYFTASAQDDQGNIYTDTIAIEVINKDQLDDLLREKWDGMKAALLEYDMDAAASYFADSNKSAYQRAFTALWSKVTQISQDIGDIQLIRMMKNAVEYDIRTIEDAKEYSYYLLFVRDRNGLWKIWAF